MGAQAPPIVPIPSLVHAERWVPGHPYRGHSPAGACGTMGPQAPPIVPMLRVGMPLWTLCVLYSSSWSTFDTLSTKKSTLCRVVHIGGLIFRMFR
ncbi:hypothetical protein GSU75_05856 [Pseudomonas savastanoi pv. phaseolicola]|nr:hypothetical protein [Pseudomonas savastanoi pv. phaseolicola]MBN4178924.1 hypothetical protein [Pseudomonas savastanoi pv. phaseolicola]